MLMPVGGFADPERVSTNGSQILIGLSLAMPNLPFDEELTKWHPPGAPWAALVLADQGGGMCKSIMTADLATVLLGALEEFWERAIAGLPVDRVDQLQALRQESRRRFGDAYDLRQADTGR